MSEKMNAAVETDETGRRVYEVGFHIVPSTAEEKIGAEVSTIKDVLEKNGAVVISEELPKTRALSYAISKSVDGRRQDFDRAYFGWIKFEAVADAVAVIKGLLERNPKIIRFLIVKTVRENTMSAPKIPSFRRPLAEKPLTPETKEGGEAKPMVSESELDKTIEAMVAE